MSEKMDVDAPPERTENGSEAKDGGEKIKQENIENTNEKERERERERDVDKENVREKEREREREKDRDSRKERRSSRKSRGDREREKDKERDRKSRRRERERRDRDKDRKGRSEKDKESETDKEKERSRDKDRKRRSRDEKEKVKEETEEGGDKDKEKDKEKEKRRNRRSKRSRSRTPSYSRSRSRSRRRRRGRRSRSDRSTSKSRSRRRSRSRRSSRSRSGSHSRRRSRSGSSSLPPPVNKRRRGELRPMWDITPEMMVSQGREPNPWQPSPDNPYFSSAAANAANAAAAAVTNPHNVDLWKNPVNSTNMTVVAQRMSGAHAGMLASAGGVTGAAAAQAAAAGVAKANIPGIVDLLSKMKAVTEAKSAMGSNAGLQSVVQQSNYLHSSRASRRVYVGNLPHTVSEDEIRQFFNATMIAAQGSEREPGDSVTNVYLNNQKRFAFVEFRTPEEATQAMELEGIMFYGESLKIGRPANYNPTMEDTRPRQTIKKLNTGRLGIVSNYVPNGPNKLYCGGIPYSLTEEQVKELLGTYGPLKAFFLAKDPATSLSKGYCFFQYEDPSVTDEAIKGLNGIKISDRQLAVRRHTPSQSTSASQFPFNPLNTMLAGARDGMGLLGNMGGPQSLPADASPVLCLSQMVTEDMLVNDAEFNDLKEDVTEECKQYGKVVTVTIPRPGAGQETVPGVGKIFVHYSNEHEAAAAKKELEGRTFDNRTVMACFYPMDQFSQGILA